MQARGKVTILILLGLTSVFIYGCSATTTISASRMGADPWPDKMVEDKIPILMEGDSFDRPYEVIGKVFVHRQKPSRFGASTSEEALVSVLRQEAIDRGAEGIIGFHSSKVSAENKDSGFERWASGIMIRFLDREVEQPVPPSFSVAILPVLNVDSTILQYSKTAQRIAQYHLESKGYYATIPQIDSALQLSRIHLMGKRELENVGGNSAYLLLITAEEMSEEHMAVFKSATSVLRIRLISVDTRAIVWEGIGAGSYAAGFLLAAFKNESKESFYPALESAFEQMSLYEGYSLDDDVNK